MARLTPSLDEFEREYARRLNSLARKVLQMEHDVLHGSALLSTKTMRQRAVRISETCRELSNEMYRLRRMVLNAR